MDYHIIVVPAVLVASVAVILLDLRLTELEWVDDKLDLIKNSIETPRLMELPVDSIIADAQALLNLFTENTEMQQLSGDPAGDQAFEDHMKKVQISKTRFLAKKALVTKMINEASASDTVYSLPQRYEALAKSKASDLLAGIAWKGPVD